MILIVRVAPTDNNGVACILPQGLGCCSIPSNLGEHLGGWPRSSGWPRGASPLGAIPRCSVTPPRCSPRLAGWAKSLAFRQNASNVTFLYTTVNFISDQREREKRCSVPPVCLPPSCQEGGEWVCHCEEGGEWICHCEVEVHSFAKGVRMDLPLQRGKSILIPVGKLTVVYEHEILPPHPLVSFGSFASLKQVWCHLPQCRIIRTVTQPFNHSCVLQSILLVIRCHDDV